MHVTNQLTLKGVENWIDPTAMESSVFRYGVPQQVEGLINLPQGDDITYTDALTALLPLLRKPVQYLEIGVSVGKNFLQIARQLHEATLTAYDIEEANPVLARAWKLDSREEWDPPIHSMKKTPSSLSIFRDSQTGNRMEYLCGDVFDEGSWLRLKPRKFNVIYSDAAHMPEGIDFEHRRLVENELLDPDELVMVWDDLWGDMADAWHRNCRRLAGIRSGCKNDFFLVPLRGWVGVHEGHHPIGFFISRRA
jgi:hypothetical protein